MNRMLSIAVLSVLLATACGVAAGQDTADHEHTHQAPPSQSSGGQPMMDMQAMMPMMMEMHQRHMAQENAWAVAEDGVYVVRGTELLKYSPQLELVKRVDLPGMAPASTAADSVGPQQTMQQKMRQMMARMHDGLAAKVVVTPDAVILSHGNRLLKYDHGLALQAQVQLAGKGAVKCPMCEQMMARMGHSVRASQK